jgi:hypothetical protein
MSKITKNDLKDIVKECLIEILAEGIVRSGSKKTLKESINKKQILGKPKKTINQNISNIRKSPNINTTLTSNNILNEMLMDTAETTLQTQLAAESKKSLVLPPNADKAAKIVDASDPIELFGEQSGKWAQLAFGT